MTRIWCQSDLKLCQTDAESDSQSQFALGHLDPEMGQAPGPRFRPNSDPSSFQSEREGCFSFRTLYDHETWSVVQPHLELTPPATHHTHLSNPLFHHATVFSNVQLIRSLMFNHLLLCHS